MAKNEKVQSNSATSGPVAARTLVGGARHSRQGNRGRPDLPHGASHGMSRSTQFLVAAALTLGLTMTFVGNLVSARVQSAALQSAAEAGALYMEAFLEPYVQELSSTATLSPQSTRALDQLTRSPSLRRHVASVKIWRTDGTVAYSTDKSITHRSFPMDEIAGALAGRVVTALEDLEQEENDFERSLAIPLYEIYAPLRAADSGKVVAVGEFYERADGLEKEIGRVRRQVWLVVGTATLAMLGLIYFFVRRGDRIIQHQRMALNARVIAQARLHRKNAKLQKRITNATHEFWKINELTLRRLGADLHDGPAQLLTLILIRLDDLAEQLGAAHGTPGEEYETIRGAAQDALREIRDISRGLALPEVNDLTLHEELQLAAQRHMQRTSTAVELALAPLPPSAPLPLKICIYRFVQECLNNAFRHADGAGQMLAASYGNGLLSVQVSDRGPGMPARAPEVGGGDNARLGLAGLRYRVESLGGFFTIDSQPGQGTTVKAQFRL
ncbi:sensor histidine kinase [Pseudomonas sp. A-1]|uniref:sensor histidine kinase n=1 Tax=unclassified Pseudomonas TaxID=196821 RepID=UPI0010A5FED1|nr:MULTISPECIES: ATP-binding protein [unclassified Pseudomonas]THG79799.1 sensor histidine kinase [Pseudomonas sp. A-1]WPP44701.1 histidine kinase [Pseudomonas sp. AN-1]